MKERSRPRFVASRVISVLVATLLVAGVVIAVTTIFQQNYPQITVTAGLSTLCATPTPLTANVTQIVAGDSGYVRYTCGTGPAFSQLAGASATPTFNLTGTIFKSLYLFKHSTPVGVACPNGDGAFQLSTGLLAGFPNTNSDWDYCARFLNAPLGGSASFAITWSA